MTLRIDQVGLSAGLADISRTDGLATGAVVTVTRTSASPGRARLLWVPPEDTTAVSTWTELSSSSWSFTPTVDAYGEYVIEEITNEDSPSEARQSRVFGVRLPNSGLLIPGLNTTADPKASVVNSGAFAVAASANNAQDFPSSAHNSVRYAGWWRSLDELYRLVDTNSREASASNIGLMSTGQVSKLQGISVNALNEAEVNALIVAGVAKWTTVLSTDFAAEASTAAVYANGNMTIGGNVYAVSRVSNDGTIAQGVKITNGVGLQFVAGRVTGGMLSDVDYSTIGAPALRIGLPGLSSLITTRTPLRIWMRVGPASVDVMPGSNVDGFVYAGVDFTSATDTVSEYLWSYIRKSYHRNNPGDASLNKGVFAQSRRNSTAIFTVGELYTADTVASQTLRIELPGGVADSDMLLDSGDIANGTPLWVPDTAMGRFGAARLTSTSTTQASAIPGAYDVANWKLVLSCGLFYNGATVSTLEAFKHTIRAIRVDALI